MYHIFIAISLTATQNFLKQESFDYAKSVATTKASKVAVLQEGNQPDLLEGLKEDERKREEEINKIAQQDIESLGLDIIDEEEPAKEVTPLIKEEKQEELPQKIAQNDPPKEIVTIDDDFASRTVPKSDLPDKKDEVNNDNIIKTEDEAKEEPEEVIVPDKKQEDNPTQEVNNDIVKKETNIIQTVSDSLSKVKDSISKTLGSEDEVTKTINTSGEELSVEENIKAQEEKEKKEEKERLKQEEIEAAAKAREEKKEKALVKLREEYLTIFSKNLQSNSIKNFIVPQKKVLPKFVNYPIPEPLTLRPKSYENRHHPDLITQEEKILLMFEAIAQNKLDDFRALFDVINNPDIKNSYGDTLLAFSILMQKYEAISFLLSNGANPNLKNKLGYTPLNIAIELADYTSVELLVNMGADINLTDGFGVTYLMQSVRVGFFPVVEFLLEKGMDVNNVDDSGFTALDFAYRDKKEVIVKYLRKYGAQTWIKKDYAKKESLIQELERRWQ